MTVLQHYPRITLLATLILCELGVLAVVLIKQTPMPKWLLFVQAVLILGLIVVSVMFVGNIRL